MARRQAGNIQFKLRLEELEKRLFILKVNYEKYFSGLERIEPLREREEVRRLVRDMMLMPVTNSTQKYKFRSLRARWNSLDLYLTRNLIMIERGTHPKMKFRANLAEQRRKEGRSAPRPPAGSAAQSDQFKAVYDAYLKARGKCGQSTDLSYDSVKEILKRQTRMIQSQYRCEQVRFKISVEGGKAKLKVTPGSKNKS